MAADAYFYSDEVSRLQVLLDEATRAKPGSPEARFVAPEAGVIDRLGSRFHHVLYGRRGTGKSSLLRQIERERLSEGHLVAWADQETFQGLAYPDVLVGTLEQVFAQFARQLRASEQAPRRRWWHRWGLGGPAPTAKAAVAARLEEAASQLLSLKAEPSDADVVWTASSSLRESDSRKSEHSVGVTKGPLKAGGSRGRSRARDTSDDTGLEQRYKTSKTEHLERAVATYRELLEQVREVADDRFVILDDFYRLAEPDQARIAGYFHRVAKDTGTWLKIGSIRYWTRLYAGGSPNVGMQVPHDIRELSLDRNLIDFASSKRFLEAILAALAAEVGVDVDKLFSHGARDRLVYAAGGVPRDYLGLIGESITVARNRGPSTKTGSERIIAEDANSAAGRTVETKFEDLKVDAGDDAEDLSQLVLAITHHCRKSGAAWFLVDYNDADLMRRMNRLQNMRFIHSLDTHETLPDQQSGRYGVFLLDASQLASQRASQVDFMGWQKREKRRARRLVFRKGDAQDAETVEPPDVAGDAELAVSAELAGAVSQPELFDDASAIVGEVDPAVEPPP